MIFVLLRWPSGKHAGRLLLGKWVQRFLIQAPARAEEPQYSEFSRALCISYFFFSVNDNFRVIAIYMFSIFISILLCNENLYDSFRLTFNCIIPISKKTV